MRIFQPDGSDVLIYALKPHPDHPPVGVSGVTVEVLGGKDDVLLTYSVEGCDRVVVPRWVTPARADGLWQTTCFELFLRSPGESGYAEFNFSPSTQWAAYRFTAHREGMRDLPRDVTPHIDRLADGIEVDCDLGGLPPGPLSMNLTAVIEEDDGTKSYWALKHAPGAPDFHNPDCFVGRLPAPERA